MVEALVVLGLAVVWAAVVGAVVLLLLATHRQVVAIRAAVEVLRVEVGAVRLAVEALAVAVAEAAGLTATVTKVTATIPERMTPTTPARERETKNEV